MSSPEQPRFSVVVPTLGRVAQLRACVEALARLDYPGDSMEVVVVNDGGGLTVERALAPLSEELHLTVLSAPRTGAAAARNAGTARARGRWIAFTDDDCLPEPGWLRALEPPLAEAEGGGVGGRVVNGAPGRGAAASQAVLDATHAHFNHGPAGPTFFATSNLALPAEGLREVGGFDERFAYAEDRELCERWLQSGRSLGYAPGAVVCHMRELTLTGVWRQHLGYGRGAWHYHRVRQERGWGRFSVEPGFYGELVRRLRRPQRGADRLSVAGLATIAQTANAAGFALEGATARLRARPRGPSR